MELIWTDYDPDTTGFVEDWIDGWTVRSTGLDEGFRAFYEYWAHEDGYVPGENFWSKVVWENGEPFAVIALCEYESKVTFMEVVVAPEKRGRGLGTKLLKELLGCEQITGLVIEKGEAVIFPGNEASKRAFEKAGFRCDHTREDGDALYYVYESGSAGRNERQ